MTKQDLEKLFEKHDFASDHLFINAAYLSELWAAEDLQQKYEAGICRDSKIQDQIEDERRHARMLHKAMLSQGFQPIEDMSYAMQEVIYDRICCFNLKGMDGSLNNFWGMHNIMERRALWNYRTYLRGGRVPVYKEVLKKVIHDEKGHIKDIPSNALLDMLQKMDYWVYRKHLAKHYNKMDLIRCKMFWTDYFTNSLNRKA